MLLVMSQYTGGSLAGGRRRVRVSGVIHHRAVGNCAVAQILRLHFAPRRAQFFVQLRVVLLGKSLGVLKTCSTGITK